MSAASLVSEARPSSLVGVLPLLPQGWLHAALPNHSQYANDYLLLQHSESGYSEALEGEETKLGVKRL